MSRKLKNFCRLSRLFTYAGGTGIFNLQAWNFLITNSSWTSLDSGLVHFSFTNILAGKVLSWSRNIAFAISLSGVSILSWFWQQNKKTLVKRIGLAVTAKILAVFFILNWICGHMLYGLANSWSKWSIRMQQKLSTK